ncbi:MAG: archease [Chloroflexi bacterium]|nr:archease [Chloroflexota bacterium]
MGGYRLLEHTADVGVEATGGDLKEAFANAAQGMFSVITDLESVQERQSRTLAVTAGDRGALLVEFLNEANFIFEVEKLLFKRFQVEELTETALRATGYGEHLDPVRHPVHCVVKAATYHQLVVEAKDGSARVRVFLDI